MSEANASVDRLVTLPVYKGADLTPEQREQNMMIVRDQTAEMLKHEHGMNTPRCTCPDCGRTLKIIWLYRCLYCGIYFCKECAEHHFGASVPPIRIAEGA